MHYSLYMHSESHNIIVFHVGVQRGMIVGLSGEGNQMGQRSASSTWISLTRCGAGCLWTPQLLLPHRPDVHDTDKCNVQLAPGLQSGRDRLLPHDQALCGGGKAVQGE